MAMPFDEFNRMASMFTNSENQDLIKDRLGELVTKPVRHWLSALEYY